MRVYFNRVRWFFFGIRDGLILLVYHLFHFIPVTTMNNQAFIIPVVLGNVDGGHFKEQQQFAHKHQPARFSSDGFLNILPSTLTSMNRFAARDFAICKLGIHEFLGVKAYPLQKPSHMYQSNPVLNDNFKGTASGLQIKIGKSFHVFS